MNSIFVEIGGIIIVATACALFARLIKQPPLFGYIVAGVILGPIGARYIQDHEVLEGMQQIGISLLLFLIGVELDWSRAKHTFKAATALAVIQVLASFAAGFALAFLGGQSAMVGVYLGMALAFSSTVIAVKLLSEARDLNSLHGRLSVGILLVQDVLAIIALVIVSGLTGDSQLGVFDQIFLLLTKTVALLTMVGVIAVYILPYLFSKIARSSELLFLSSVAWCFIFTLAMSRFDFPIEIGAFLAGISLAALPYNLDIISRLRSLRDFFVIMLFVSLGTSLVFPSAKYIALTIGLILLTVLVKPLITFVTLSSHGYRSRTAFLTALTQGQLSEFSLIIVTIGLASGHIGRDLGSTIIFTAVVSILISTFLFTHRRWLFEHLKRPLRHLERGHAEGDFISGEMATRLDNHIVIFGYHRMGYHIMKKLHKLGHKILIVDFNPDIIAKLRAQGIDCVYGDVEDDEIFEHIRLDKASMIVSTIPHHDENLFLIERVKSISKTVKLIVTTHSIDDALLFYKQGADYVILPHLLGGEHVAELITQYQEHSLTKFMHSRAEELKLLRAKNNVLYYD